MSKNFLITFVAGLALVAALIAGVLYSKRGAHLAPSGSILKVRTQALDDKHSLAVMEIRMVNDSDVVMVVRQIEPVLETKDGKQTDGTLMSGDDAKKIFTYYPMLGQLYNDPLMIRDRIGGHQTVDRMVVVRFDLPEQDLIDRKQITLRVEDENGAVAVVTGK